MKAQIKRSSPIKKTGRVLQMCGMFDVAPSTRSQVTWDVDLPLDEKPWQIGLIVGPSGSGKSTIARQLFGDNLVDQHRWPKDQSILDGFPKALGIKELTGLLSSVGFSSPPAWCRPYHVLSTGEQFRVTVARALAEAGQELVVIDEFTSVIDRTVAQIGSAAVAKTIRRTDRRFVAVTCHYDVEEWLQPDWIYQPADNRFAWRLVRRRPPLDLEIIRVHSSAWHLFKPHHYLSGAHSRSAACYVALVNGEPAAYLSILHFPHPKSSSWREHRLVVLPDYQGIGLGNRLSEHLAAAYRSTGKRYRGVSTHPALIGHRLRSPLWRCVQRGSLRSPIGRNGDRSLSRTTSTLRAPWSFVFAGPADPATAAALGVGISVSRKKF
jgi:ABC-type lipoprotein export system ATPase subunit/GNAT superfamily N-acetyltransferase